MTSDSDNPGAGLPAGEQPEGGAAPQPEPLTPPAVAPTPAAREPLPWGQQRPPAMWTPPPTPVAWPPYPPAPYSPYPPSPYSPYPPSPYSPYPPSPYPSGPVAWPPYPPAPYPPYPPAPWIPPLAPPPWGYAFPPFAQMPPVGDPPAPGSQHPPASRRPVASVAGRAAPRLYGAGWAFSLAGLAALVTLIAATTTGLTRDLDLWLRAGLLEGSLAAITVGLGAAALAQTRQRRADGWQDYFGPSPLLVTGVVLALSTAASLPVAGALAWLDVQLASSVELLLMLLVNLACYALVTHWLAVRTGALTWSDMARPQHLAPDRGELLEAFWNAYRPAARPRTLRLALADVGLGLGLAVPAMIGSLILAVVLSFLLNLQDVQTSGDSYQIVTTWDFWIVLLGLAVVAPIGEEILFRGFITNAWARSLPRNSALLRGTFLFASVHILNNAFDSNSLDLAIRLAVLAVAVRLPVAWLLGWIYTSRRSLIASVALHGAYNGALVLVAWWAINQSY